MMMRTLLAVAPTSCSIVAAVPRRRVGGAKVSFAVIYLTTHKCCCGSVSTPATASQPLEQLLRPPHLGRTTARTSNAAPMVFSTPKKRPVYSFLPLHHTHLDSSGFRGDPPHLACRESPFCHPPPNFSRQYWRGCFADPDPHLQTSANRSCTSPAARSAGGVTATSWGAAESDSAGKGAAVTIGAATTTTRGQFFFSDMRMIFTIRALRRQAMRESKLPSSSPQTKP